MLSHFFNVLIIWLFIVLVIILPEKTNSIQLIAPPRGSQLPNSQKRLQQNAPGL